MAKKDKYKNFEKVFEPKTNKKNKDMAKNAIKKAKNKKD